MKKLLTVLIVLVFIVLFAGCDEDLPTVKTEVIDFEKSLTCNTSQEANINSAGIQIIKFCEHAFKQ